MILCIGEILADMIGIKSESGVCYERKAGGAPFNVACAAKKLGAEVKFYGAVGDDLIGRFLIDFARARGVGENIATNKQFNTTLAFVELDENGERSFCFYRKNTADIHLPYIPDSELKAADTVHIGSLMLSEQIGIDYAVELIDRAHAFGKTVSFDVNFRTDLFKDTDSAISAYKTVLELADIVKFSDDEIGIFTDEYVSEKLGDKFVCVTLGARGSEWRFCGKTHTAPTISVKPVDTTGAGDAFYGGVLACLDGKSLTDMTDEELCAALKFGNVCGALNTLGHGAIDALPDKNTVTQRLKTL